MTKRIVKIIIVAVTIAVGIFISYRGFFIYGPNIPRKYKQYIETAYGNDVKFENVVRDKSDDCYSRHWNFKYTDAKNVRHSTCFKGCRYQSKSREENEYINKLNVVETALIQQENIVIPEFYDKIVKKYFSSSSEDYILCYDFLSASDLSDSDKSALVDSFVTSKNGLIVSNCNLGYIACDERLYAGLNIVFHDEDKAMENIPKIKAFEKEFHDYVPHAENYYFKLTYSGNKSNSQNIIYSKEVVLGKEVTLNKNETFYERVYEGLSMNNSKYK